MDAPADRFGLAGTTLAGRYRAEVWIDGKNTGKHTPFVDVPIDCGPHRIDFKRPDLQIAESESIEVKPGQTFKRRYTLAGGAD